MSLDYLLEREHPGDVGAQAAVAEEVSKMRSRSPSSRIRIPCSDWLASMRLSMARSGGAIAAMTPSSRRNGCASAVSGPPTSSAIESKDPPASSTAVDDGVRRPVVDAGGRTVRAHHFVAPLLTDGDDADTACCCQLEKEEPDPSARHR